MYRRIFFALSLLIFGFAQISFGQETANLQSDLPLSSELYNHSNEDWTVYADEENNVFYIDFENLTVNLNDIVVRDEQGNIVLREEVFDLPVNTIYELDLSEYGPGTFQIELRAFTGVIRKTVSVR